MSHYAVAIFADSPRDEAFDELMDPYSENDERYFIFEPVSDDELLQHWEKFKAQNPSWKYSDWLNECYTLRDGRYGHWYNPYGYYDYYALDARAYMYHPLPGFQDKHEDFFRKSEIDWFAKDPDNDFSEQEWREKWREYSTRGHGLCTPEYYHERYQTEEQFVAEMMRPWLPYAFVTPDGKWHAPGRVGWFACSDETAESMDAYYAEWIDFIKNAPDCYVSLADCHI